MDGAELRKSEWGIKTKERESERAREKFNLNAQAEQKGAPH